MSYDWRDFKARNGGETGARAAFEQACESLIRKMHPGAQQVRANPGDDGIDIYVGSLGLEPIVVYQCKFHLEQVGKSQEQQIRDSFRTAVNSTNFRMKKWVLCLPKVLDLTEHKWWSAFREKALEEVDEVELLNGNELLELAKKYGLTEAWFDKKFPRKIIHLPYNSIGTLFKGREEFLDDLQVRLTESKSGIATINRRPIVLYGTGGIGKTRTAIEYAWRNTGHYTTILLISANSPEALVSNIAGLSSVLKIQGMSDATDEDRVKAVFDWLQTNPGWLLILDNVDHDAASHAVRSQLSALSSGHVIITSRLSTWSGAVEKLELKLLAPDAACDYLLQAADQRNDQPEDAKQSKVLAQKIGYLALGLEHAAAYINARGWSFAEYLQQWDTDEESILAEFDLSQIDYPRQLLITWRLSVDRLDTDSRTLLDILSWLAPQPLTESTFEILETFDIKQVQAAVNLLVKYCLLKREIFEGVRRYTQHQLVQATTRYHQRKGQRRESEIFLPRLDLALAWMGRAFTGDTKDVRIWPKLDPLVPHVLEVCEFANREGKISELHSTTILLNQLGTLFLSKARHHDAERLLRRALSIDEQSYGNDHPQVAVTLNNLSQLLQDTDRLSEAEPLMRRALAIDEARGPDHHTVAIRLANLGNLLQFTRRFDEAERLLRRALAIDEKFYGSEHPNVASDLGSLAQLYQDTKRTSEAEALMRRALGIVKKAYETDHPDVAVHSANLGQLLSSEGRFPEAEQLFSRALAIDERYFGPDHPNVAFRCTNLGTLLCSTNRAKLAEPLLRRAASIFENTYGKNDRRVASALNSLARVLQTLNRLPEAEQLMRRALEIDEHSYGPEHPQVAIRLNNLGALLRATKRLTEAEPRMRRAVLIHGRSRRATAYEHTYMQQAIANYRALLKDLGKSEPEIDQIIAGLLK